MPPVNQPPIGLTDQEILCVIAALQTLGGTPTVTLETKHNYNSGAAAPGARRPLRRRRARNLDRAASGSPGRRRIRRRSPAGRPPRRRR